MPDIEQAVARVSKSLQRNYHPVLVDVPHEVGRFWLCHWLQWKCSLCSRYARTGHISNAPDDLDTHLRSNSERGSQEGFSCDRKHR
jgi:hypothetical protein